MSYRHRPAMLRKRYPAEFVYQRRYTTHWRTRASKLVEDMKASGCVDCGYRGPSVALDLDHVRGAKVGHVSRLVIECTCPRGYEVLVAELAKCEVVCAICHRIRTHRRRRYWPRKRRDPQPTPPLLPLFAGGVGESGGAAPPVAP